MDRKYILGDAPLSLHDVRAIVTDYHQVTLSGQAQEKINTAYQFLLDQIAAGSAIYGVTTGLGANVDTTVLTVANGQYDPQHLQAIQQRIPLARAVGVGELASRQQVRAIMLARLAGIAQGVSGMTLPVAQTIEAFINQGIHPEVPLTGSLGEADLAPLAHIARVMIGQGQAEYQGSVRDGAELLKSLAISPAQLQGKDGLALVSSNAASTGLAALLLIDIAQIINVHSGAIALSFEGFRANVSPLLPPAAKMRPAPHQTQTAAHLLNWLEGSQLLTPEGPRALQDPLSFRCISSVLASVSHYYALARSAVVLELNSADDNPALLYESDRVLANANFDATHLALAMESISLALSRLAVCTGERIMKLMSPAASNLPRFLTRHTGQSGFATLQKTVSALVSEIAHHAQPLSPITLSVADKVEDYASQAMGTIRKTQRLVESLRYLVAIELLVAAQAVDLQTQVKLGPRLQCLQDKIRGQVAMLDEDRASGDDIMQLSAVLMTEEWLISQPTLLEIE